jgi:poly-gamma-glutamate synthesis protein (capsule biosynthesis protein)
MKSVKNQKSRRKWLIVLGCILIVLVSGAVTILWVSKSSAPSVDKKPAAVKPTPQPKSISSNVLFLGNTFWGRYINDWSMASPLKYAYPFSRLSEFNRDSYDAWISGLECPTVAGVNVTSAQQEQALQFNCSPDYLPDAAKWFTAFTLANNHTDNQGIEGFSETQQQLEKNGIQYFGNYDPKVADDACEIISLPVTVTNDNDAAVKGKLPVAMCAFHGVFQIPPTESVAVIQKYNKHMPVIAMPHMGAEYKSEPDQIKTDFYRSLIDAGADMVIGDHPHWIQTSESYNGHLIVYSMGNFMFDQQDTPEVVRSAGIRVVMKTNGSDSALIKRWLTLGETCSKYKDDCLNKVSQQKLTKLNFDYQFGVVGTNDGDKIVKPATPEQQASIVERLKLQSATGQLQSPYSGLKVE